MLLNQKKALSQKGYIGGDEEARYGRGRDYHNDFREIRYGAPGSKNRLSASGLRCTTEVIAYLLFSSLRRNGSGRRSLHCI